MRWLAFLIAISAVMRAQEVISATPPRVISKTEPEYSEEARIGRLQGTVVIQFNVGAGGAPENIQVKKPLGLGLDEQAILSVKGWRFQPATSHGEPVSTTTTIEIEFRTLTNPKTGHLSSAKFDVPAGASRPILRAVQFPRAWEPAPPITLLFEVNESGSAVLVRAKDGGRSEWRRDLIEALEKWKFSPGMKDGSPIRVPAEFTFTLR